MEAICNGMNSAMKFMKSTTDLGISEHLIAIHQSLPCLEFIIGDLGYIKKVVDFLSEKLPQMSESVEKIELAEGRCIPLISAHVSRFLLFLAITLGLLAYNTEVIKEEAYRIIHRKVLTSIGPKLDVPINGVAGSQILFLLNSKVMVEMAAFGLNSDNQEVKNLFKKMLMLQCFQLHDFYILLFFYNLT